MQQNRVTRRHVLGLGSGVVTATLAGCEALSEDGPATPREPELDHLASLSVFVAADLDLDVPDAVPTVDARADADLLVLPADTGVDATQAIDWLEGERVVALLGDSAQETWLEWVQSDAYEQAFGRQGYAESEPAPDLLVLVPREDGVTGHNYTWGSGYDDRDVLEGLEDAFGPE